MPNAKAVVYLVYKWLSRFIFIFLVVYPIHRSIILNKWEQVKYILEDKQNKKERRI